MTTFDSKAMTFSDINEDDTIAAEILQTWYALDGARQPVISRINEVTKYLEADRFDYALETENPEADTRDMFENRTTTPKIAQIAQIYKAKGESVLFPSDASSYLDYRAKTNPPVIENGQSEKLARKEQRDVLRAWLRTKMDQSNAQAELVHAFEDYLYGNAFIMVEYMDDYTFDEVGNRVQGYRGPVFRRIPPEDIVFNSRARNFLRTPKIIRTVTTVADVVRDAEDAPEDEALQQIKDVVLENRRKFTTHGREMRSESVGIAIDAEMTSYFNSHEVEMLTYYGDFYDKEAGKLYRNHKIVVVDRSYTVYNEPLDSWLTFPPIFHAPMNRQRNSLYGLGVFYNILGLQYRLDHLANKNADARDRALNPVMFAINVDLSNLELGKPDQVVYGDDDSRLEFVTPPTEMLVSSIQEQRDLLVMMEEMAGAPREIMGIRSPGEKTAFEVQELASNSQELFISRLRKFEKDLLIPAFLAFQEIGIRRMEAAEAVQLVTPEGVEVLKNITKSDLTQSGNFVPVGASNFAEKSKVLRTISQFTSQGFFNLPTVAPHISGIALAKAFEALGDLEPYDIVEENIALAEQQETQLMAAEARSQNEAAAATPSGIGSDPIAQ